MECVVLLLRLVVVVERVVVSTSTLAVVVLILLLLLKLLRIVAQMRSAPGVLLTTLLLVVVGPCLLVSLDLSGKQLVLLQELILQTLVLLVQHRHFLGQLTVLKLHVVGRGQSHLEVGLQRLDLALTLLRLA